MGPNCIEIRCLWPSSEDSYPEVGLAKGIFVPESRVSGKFETDRVSWWSKLPQPRFREHAE